MKYKSTIKAMIIFSLCHFLMIYKSVTFVNEKVLKNLIKGDLNGTK